MVTALNAGSALTYRLVVFRSLSPGSPSTGRLAKPEPALFLGTDFPAVESVFANCLSVCRGDLLVSAASNVAVPVSIIRFDVTSDKSCESGAGALIRNKVVASSIVDFIVVTSLYLFITIRRSRLLQPISPMSANRNPSGFFFRG